MKSVVGDDDDPKEKPERISFIHECDNNPTNQRTFESSQSCLLVPLSVKNVLSTSWKLSLA